MVSSLSRKVGSRRSSPSGPPGPRVGPKCRCLAWSRAPAAAAVRAARSTRLCPESRAFGGPTRYLASNGASRQQREHDPTASTALVAAGGDGRSRDRPDGPLGASGCTRQTLRAQSCAPLLQLHALDSRRRDLDRLLVAVCRSSVAREAVECARRRSLRRPFPSGIRPRLPATGDSASEPRRDTRSASSRSLPADELVLNHRVASGSTRARRSRRPEFGVRLA